MILVQDVIVICDQIKHAIKIHLMNAQGGKQPGKISAGIRDDKLIDDLNKKVLKENTP